MQAEGVIRPILHYAGVAQKLPAPALDQPATEPAIAEARSVTVKLPVASCPVEYAPEIMHDLGVGVHGGESVAISLRPRP